MYRFKKKRGGSRQDPIGHRQSVQLSGKRVMTAAALTQWLPSAGLDNGAWEVRWDGAAELQLTLAEAQRSERPWWHNRSGSPVMRALRQPLRSAPGADLVRLSPAWQKRVVHSAVGVFCQRVSVKRLLTETLITSFFLWIPASDCECGPNTDEQFS